MLLVLPTMSYAKLIVLQQIRLLQEFREVAMKKTESSSTFCNKFEYNLQQTALIDAWL